MQPTFQIKLTFDWNKNSPRGNEKYNEMFHNELKTEYIVGRR